MPTKVNAASIQRKASQHPAYDVHMDFALEEFKRDYPRVTGLDVLTMRAVLAGDVTLVRVRQGKLCLWFTDELDELRALNEETRRRNREAARAAAKKRREYWEQLLQRNPEMAAILHMVDAARRSIR